VTLLGLGIVVPDEVAAELKATGARPAIFGEGSRAVRLGGGIYRLGITIASSVRFVGRAEKWEGTEGC
jgi:hypothetical protein